MVEIRRTDAYDLWFRRLRDRNAPSRGEALAGIRAPVANCADDMRACGEPLPEAAGDAIHGSTNG